MIFRQLFDSASSTYSYLLASRRGGEALIIDPVLERVDRIIFYCGFGERSVGQGRGFASLYSVNPVEVRAGRSFL